MVELILMDNSLCNLFISKLGGLMVNLVELHTVNGAVYIDTKELDSGITNLTAYTCQGLADAKVQRDKLFASSDLADQNYNRVLVDITSRSRRHTDKLRRRPKQALYRYLFSGHL